MTELVVETVRGDAVEAEHPVSAALVDASGAVHAVIGPQGPTTWRSAAKPFQLEASLSLLPPDEVAALTDEELALGAASHSGEAGHVAVCDRLLRRFDLPLSALACGAHAPMHAGAAAAMIRAGHAPDDRHNNCSGKHSFMLGASARAGFAGDYRDPGHAYQQQALAVIRSRTGEEPSLCVDGCGVPCFVLSLQGMALAYAQLAVATAEGDGLLGQIGRAIQRTPWHLAGTDRDDLRLMVATREPILAKIGAEGLMCIAVPGSGLGLALKVRTGHDLSRIPATLSVLRRYFPDLLPDDALPEATLVRNVAGRPVGARRASWR